LNLAEAEGGRDWGEKRESREKKKVRPPRKALLPLGIKKTELLRQGSDEGERKIFQEKGELEKRSITPFVEKPLVHFSFPTKRG